MELHVRVTEYFSRDKNNRLNKKSDGFRFELYCRDLFPTIAEAEAAGEKALAEVGNDAQLAATTEALRAANHGGDGECVWCGALVAFDHLSPGESSHAPDCPRQRALSGDRAAELGAVLSAAREVERTQRIPGWERTPEEVSQHSAERKHWLIVLGDAVRAAYPPDPVGLGQGDAG